MRSGLAFAAVVGTSVLVTVGGLAIAQKAGARRQLLHEDLPAPVVDKTNPVVGDGSNGPTAIKSGGRLVPAPRDDKTRTGEPVFGGKQANRAADRKTSIEPDTNTGQDPALTYESVFSPDVIPFKRMSVFDAVSEDYKMITKSPALAEIPVGGKTDASKEDAFWGSMLIQLEKGKDVALPSVAPDMVIRSYKVDPPIRLRFSKDAADNFYVRSDESNAGGQYRLTFQASAPLGYFAPDFPKNRYTPRLVGTMAPPEIRVKLPDRVREQAFVTLKKIDVDADMALVVAFDRLVEYFRGFEAKQLTKQTGDVYRDLCDAQAGVCRHRAFTFMITANALGIPTRYVENEAHAFAEVWFPERGWQRIDLGGAALRMDVHGMKDRRPHKPRSPDPFKKPPEYTNNNYSRLDGKITGLSDDKLAEYRDPSATPSGQMDNQLPSSPNPNNNQTVMPGQEHDQLPEDPKKPKPHLEVTLADSSAYRGDTIHVEARVHDGNGKPIADHNVTVFLAPAGKRGSDAVEIGTGVTDADGMLKGDFSIPSTISLAAWEVYLSSPPDAFYNASISQ